MLCKQPEGEICRPLVAVCGIYDCAPGATSLLLCQVARGAVHATRGGDFDATGSYMLYTIARQALHLSCCTKGRAVLCKQTEGEILMSTVSCLW